MKRRTNFDQYLARQLKDPAFKKRFKDAGDAWDIGLQLAALRKASGMSQKELAKQVGTSQQQISRLESPSYEGHSLSMLRRVAEVLSVQIHLEIQPRKHPKQLCIGESKSIYRVKGKRSPEGKYK